MFVSAVLQSQQAPPTPVAPPPDAKQQKSQASAKPAAPAPTAEEKWLYPAQRVSADLESQASRLKRDLHAVALTTLGSYWWKQDRAAAEHWIYPAIDEITLVPQEESDGDRSTRLESARRVLSIITPLDPVLRERLKDVVTAAVPREGSTSSGARSQTADALVISAMNGPPAQLAQAITDALQYGVTESTVVALVDLAAKLPNDAQQLFDRALSQAVNNPAEMPAFAVLLKLPQGSSAPGWREAVISAYTRAVADGLLDQNARCTMAGDLSRVSQSMTDASATQLAAAALSDCASGGPEAAADANIVRREDPKTSDDYLHVASEAKLASTRYDMKLTAGEKAEEEAKKDDTPGPEDGPVKALRILDGMMPDERAVRPSEYKRRREDVAVRAALWAMHFSRCPGAMRVVDTSPRETLFHVAVGVAEKMTDRFCYEELMRTTVLRQPDRNPAEDPNDYVRAINLVLRRGPYPEQSFQQILRAMDSWKERDPKTAARGEVVYTAAWNKLYPMTIVPELFDISPEMLRAITRGYFRNELLRTDLELLLVKGFLDRYARDLQKEKQNSVAEK